MSNLPTIPETTQITDMVNLTPHDINICVDGHTSPTYVVPRSGVVARLNSEQTQIGDFNGIPLYSPQKFTGVSGVVMGEYGPPIIVSALVGEFMAKEIESKGLTRRTIYSPDTSPNGSVRDDKGRIIGTKRLICYMSA